MAQARSFPFVLHNYTDDDIEKLKTVVQALCKRVVFYREVCPSTGTPHLQGYVEFKKKMRLTQINNLMPNRWSVRPDCKGTGEENAAYCRKGSQSKEEWKSLKTKGPNYGKDVDPNGYEWGVSENVAGQRTDLEAFKTAVKDGMLCKKRLREVHTEVCAKYPRFVEAYLRDQITIPNEPDHPFYSWQQALFDKIEQPPNKRTVNFVVGTVGDDGKTWFSNKYIETHDDAFKIRPGKHADLASLLPDRLRVLFLDCTRDQLTYLPYTLLEELKDGYVQSTKYEVCIKRYAPMHVVVLMNELPDMTKLSPDRYNVIVVDNTVVPSFVPHPSH